MMVIKACLLICRHACHALMQLGDFMRAQQRFSKVICTVLIFCILFASGSSFADNGVTGKQFKTFIYSPYSDAASTTITFRENFALLIDMYEGFGIYTPVGASFVAFFSAP